MVFLPRSALASSLLCLLALGACGDDGPDGPNGGGSGNRTPNFTSATAASVPENGAGTVYQAAATDPDGDTITYALGGGADAALFRITAGGALSFAAAPNFEDPQDANRDNVYEVRISASDGRASSTLDIALTITNGSEQISLRRVGTGFAQPLHIAAIPGSGDVLVAEKGGRIYRLNPSTGGRTLVQTVTRISTDGERGLLGIVATDRYATDNSIFAVATATDGAVEVREYVLGTADAGGATAPYQVALRVPHADFNNHNGGWIGYGPDGNVYVGVGDGGGSGDPAGNAQNRNVRLGKILRFTRDPAPVGGAAPYRPAPGNPFIDGGGDPYVFAYGLRNPFRAAFAGNTLIIGDVGQNRHEEIDLVRTDQPGLNFGWPFREGLDPFSGTAPSGLVDPVSQYDRGSGPLQGASVIGGHVYRGPVASLRGAYMFGDFVSGNIWTIPAATLLSGAFVPTSRYERRNGDLRIDAGTVAQLASFGEDAAGNLYLVDLDGDIFQIVQ